MKRYCIKCRSGRIEYFDIISETDEAFNIRLTKLSDGSEKVIEESMSRTLFDICLQTGYIFKLEGATVSVA